MSLRFLEEHEMKKLIVFGMVLCVAGVANASLITGVSAVGQDDDPGVAAATNLQNGALAYLDRNHVLEQIPDYLKGAEYVMTSNDDRNNRDYELHITLSEAATLYLYIDNRIGDDDNTDGPLIGYANPNQMLWVDCFGWTDTDDDMAIDEGDNDTIDQYFSIYSKDVDAGTTILYKQDWENRNMYGVAAVPEPATIALLGFGALSLIRRKRS
jgi:hypothetical protein